MTVIETSFEKRHSSTHFANIKYGYYVFVVTLLYLIFIYGIRKVSPKTQLTLRRYKIWRLTYSINPYWHLLILSFALVIPFFGHYSLKENASLYLKRIGRLSYVLLSLNLFISLRPPIFPFFEEYTYDEFIPLHKWLSRFIIILSIIHGIGFFMKWGLDKNVNTMAKITKKWNTLGEIVFVMIMLLLITSVKWFRRRHYQSFYIIHNITTVSFILLVALHARPGVAIPYLVINIVLLGVHFYNKYHGVRQISILSKEQSKETDMIIVRLDKTCIDPTFPAGSHIRLSPYLKHNPLYWLTPSHPYTVVTTPDSEDIKLLITESKFRIMPNKSYSLTGPYNSNIPNSLCETAERVILIAGGSGISYILPLYRHLINCDRTIPQIRLLWVVKSIQDYNFLKRHKTITEENIELFITTELNSKDVSSEDVEMRDPYVERRINWQQDLQDIVITNRNNTVNPNTNTWMVCCGPPSLLQDASTFALENAANFLSEHYSL